MTDTLDLGAFSVSLAVQDLARSRAFFKELGFRSVGGAEAQNFLILRNGTTTIGLFQGMFESNILTFNPGWTADGAEVEGAFTDVRKIQARLLGRGLTPVEEADPESTGPAHLVLTDPDGNAILIDQHRDAPA